MRQVKPLSMADPNHQPMKRGKLGASSRMLQVAECVVTVSRPLDLPLH